MVRTFDGEGNQGFPDIEKYSCQQPSATSDTFSFGVLACPAKTFTLRLSRRQITGNLVASLNSVGDTTRTGRLPRFSRPSLGSSEIPSQQATEGSAEQGALYATGGHCRAVCTRASTQTVSCSISYTRQ